MNKIEFFNYIMKIHDSEYKVYNEYVADLILSGFNNEFNIFYDIYLKLSTKYKVRPSKIKINDNDEIVYFSLRTSDKEFEEIFNLLSKEGTEVVNEYSTAECKYKKSMKKSVIYIYINITKLKHEVTNITFVDGKKMKVIN